MGVRRHEAVEEVGAGVQSQIAQLTIAGALVRAPINQTTGDQGGGALQHHAFIAIGSAREHRDGGAKQTGSAGLKVTTQRHLTQTHTGTEVCLAVHGPEVLLVAQRTGVPVLLEKRLEAIEKR